MKNFFDNLIKGGKMVVDNSDVNKNSLREAYIFAEKNSTDLDTWTGAVIKDGDNLISMGTNRFAQGVKATEERMQKPKKYLCQDHAERNAIYVAAADGKKLAGTTMYMPWVPCCACASAIISSEIKSLVMHYDNVVKTPKDWLNDVQEAVSMLLEGDVNLFVVTEKIGDCSAKFRSEIWFP